MMSRMWCFLPVEIWVNLGRGVEAERGAENCGLCSFSRGISSSVPSISRMETRAASSYDELSDPAVRLPKPRQTHCVMTRLPAGSMSRSSMSDRAPKHVDARQVGA